LLHHFRGHKNVSFTVSRVWDSADMRCRLHGELDDFTSTLDSLRLLLSLYDMDVVFDPPGSGLFPEVYLYEELMEADLHAIVSTCPNAKLETAEH